MLEKTLIDHKSTIASILSTYGSKNRLTNYALFLDKLIESLGEQQQITDQEIVRLSGLSGKVLVGARPYASVDFSDNAKSETFIRKALETALICPICKGYLDPNKSMSYDHINPKREGGRGETENCDLTHSYCNQSIKN